MKKGSNKTLKFLLILTLTINLTTYGACLNPCNSCCDCDNSYLGPCDGYPFLQIRSQGRDSARELVGLQEFINQYCMDSKYAALSVTVEYSRSFRGERPAHFLFGNDLVNNCCELLIQGDEPCGDATSRNPKAWFADHFGLTGSYSSKVSFCPRIQNAIIDFNLYIGLDNITEGLYFKINAPLAWTKWELCMRENVVCDAHNDYHPAGYMAETKITKSEAPQTFAQYMAGGYTFGDMQTPMQYGLISKCGCTKTKLAELDLTLGYNFHLEEDHHFGFFGYVAAPTGTRPNAKYLFEPTVGNGKHWEFGAGISGSWIFLRNKECCDKYMGLWLDATVSHLFKTCQRRSFDFKCKPNSRYMLLAQIDSNIDAVKLGDNTTVATTGNYQYAKNLIPAINWSTCNVKVQIPVQADIAVKFGYVRENWNFDLGYNFWARTGEKFSGCCKNCNNKKYALKGDMYLYGQETNNGNKILPLPVSQSLADIHTGKNWPKIGAENPRTNPRVDNPTLAWANNNIALHSVSDGITYQMNGSQEPELVTYDMLNMSKSPSSITHKIFVHFGYAKKDDECDEYIPFLGIGGSVEFAQDSYKDCCCCSCYDCFCSSCNTKDNTSCNTYCNDCECPKRGAVSLWGIWIKGGLSFD